jgi:hypothetical protein
MEFFERVNYENVWENRVQGKYPRIKCAFRIALSATRDDIFLKDVIAVGDA